MLRADDLAAADRIFRTAFGTFLRLPDPMRFGGDTDYVRTRWRIDPTGAFVAEDDGEVVGSVFAAHWGSFGFFGPLSVRPELWGRRIAQALLAPVMAYFDGAGVTHAGLFTFAESAKHVALYGKYGFHPRFLTAVMARSVAPGAAAPVRTLGALSEAERSRVGADCRAVTETLHAGLDLGAEMAATLAHALGDVVLLADADGRVRGFAVCHVGAGTEAGTDACYVKFGAVACGSDAAQAALARRGFRTVIQGVALHRPNAPGFSRPDVFALDDWR